MKMIVRIVFASAAMYSTSGDDPSADLSFDASNNTGAKLAAAPGHVLIQLSRETQAKAIQQHITNSSCCGGCAGRAFCSPRSGNCYASQAKHYYQACSTASASCCDGCDGSGYCSPRSGNCYDGKAKDYYQACSVAISSCCGGCQGSGYCSPRSGNCYQAKAKDYYESCSAASVSCCDGCDGNGYCSPRSGNCYELKAKDYYETCSAASPTESPTEAITERTTGTVAPGAAQCCALCPGRKFCSPNSGNCYYSKNKDYYAECPPCVGEDCPIGWNPTSKSSGVGRWCEVGQPVADWSALKTCPTGAGTTTVKVLAYNLFWWNLFNQRGGENGRAGRKIATTSPPEEYDLMGFQECDDVWRVLADAKSHGLPGEYAAINGGRALAIAYLKSRWTLLDSGKEDVGEDAPQQFYGRRSAHWARLRHSDGAIVFFVNHHGPLPVSISGGCAGSATAYNIMRLIAENARPGDAIILVGDFNAQAHSSRIQALDRHMHRTFTGTSHGGVDHIYSNCAGASVIKSDNLGSGGSDHDALSAIYAIPH